MARDAARVHFPELSDFTAMMRREGLSGPEIDYFQRLYRRYRTGDTGVPAFDELGPPPSSRLLQHDAIRSAENERRGRSLYARTACIKLNGGLSTTMPLDKGAKSLVEVRDGLTFLGIIAYQLHAMRAVPAARPPLVLMNSFRTREASLDALSEFEQPDDLPLDFLQHRFPRIDAETHGPALGLSAGQRWAPPGHGDVYLALWLSGLLSELVERGYEWGFISNADNLAAVVEPCLLGHLDHAGLDFAMEVTPKTASDRKGGCLVAEKGMLRLLERGQIPADQAERFDDAAVFSLFNTNTIWVRLPSLLKLMEGGSLNLPVIVNHKHVEGHDIVQLETAMGAAVSSFEQSVAVIVDRNRFAPVKSTCDLIAVRSDAYVLGDDGALRPSSQRAPGLGAPVIWLDERYYGSLRDFDARFPAGVPSLRDCRSLRIYGDVRFDGGVVLRGDVSLRNLEGKQKVIEAGTTLADRNITWS